MKPFAVVASCVMMMCVGWVFTLTTNAHGNHLKYNHGRFHHELLKSVSLAAKVDPEVKDGQASSQFVVETSEDPLGATKAKLDGSGRQVTVSSLVIRALADQKLLIEARLADLERWNEADQQHFAIWFGTVDPQAREFIYERLRVLQNLNRQYSVANFRQASPSQPNLFAFVRINDPSTIFVDRRFIFSAFLGENSRAGVLCHEMSHFNVVGGTKDYVYGTEACQRLAAIKPSLALMNADNFEFYMEQVR